MNRFDQVRLPLSVSTMEQFKDHFSNQAAAYARFRPGYPPELFSSIARLCENHRIALDCGTGNGQCAVGLTPYFKKVIAIDPSSEQIANAQKSSKIDYRVLPAEQTGLPAASLDLLTVAQALHWFDRAKFFAEAIRILAPRGLFAAWTYGKFLVDGCQKELDHFYTNIIGPYWPPERASVDKGYADIALPPEFERVEGPSIFLSRDWTLEQLLGYVSTWSSVQKYREANGEDPVQILAEALQPLWSGESRLVQWPVFFLCGRKIQ
ncbi:MAG: class I SAM-dependent methyltransferase [Leptospiraceae bacterium]|nr:class I SAM-dependent methyltransferase [Leptospiraceae bacterium]